MNHELKNVSQKYLIIVAGPTAAGKTDVAIRLANHYNTSIISADSRQIFKELNIGVARPSLAELQRAPHYFIANKSIHDYYSAGEYEREVILLLDDLFQKNDVVILCGGTGFYINAILNGFDEIPKVAEHIRIELNNKFQKTGIEPLKMLLKELDEISYQKIDLQNTQRVIRALEVCIGTGQPFSTFKKEQKPIRNFTPIKIGINLPQNQLHANINLRVDKMMTQGLLEEAKAVYPYRQHNALQTVGYKELFDFLEHKTTLPEAVEWIKIHTRQYAKRQLTFFNKNDDYLWFEPKFFDFMIKYIENERDV